MNDIHIILHHVYYSQVRLDNRAISRSAASTEQWGTLQTRRWSIHSSLWISHPTRSCGDVVQAEQWRSLVGHKIFAENGIPTIRKSPYLQKIQNLLAVMFFITDLLTDSRRYLAVMSHVVKQSCIFGDSDPFYRNQIIKLKSCTVLWFFREAMKDVKGTTTVAGLWKMNTMVKTNITKNDEARYKCTVKYSQSPPFNGGSADSKTWNVNVIGW